METIMLEAAAHRLACKPHEVRWWSWPEVFGSTSGPHGGIGGQAMTTFQVYGFRSEERGVVYCAGKWGVWMNTELSWKRRLRKP